MQKGTAVPWQGHAKAVDRRKSVDSDNLLLRGGTAASVEKLRKTLSIGK